MIDTSVPSQDILAQLVKNSLDGIVAFDQDCRYTMKNATDGADDWRSMGGGFRSECFRYFPISARDQGEDRYFYDALAADV